jgi:hypothetical protein
MSIEMNERNFEAVEDGVEKKFKVVKPTFSVGNRADRIYKKAFAEALRDGILTAFQMREQIDEIEYYSNTNKEIDTIDNRLAELEIEITEEESYEKGMMMVLEMRELRARRVLEVYKINTIYENTAESYAENIRNQYYASELTCKEDGSRVWSSFEDFQNKMTDDLAATSVQQVMLFNAKISNNYQMDYAENQWLVKKGIINEEGVPIKQEKPEEPDKEEPKKVKGKKKRAPKKKKVAKEGKKKAKAPVEKLQEVT